MIEKFINRLRRRVAQAMEPARVLPTRQTHIAYPELQVQTDGSWVCRWYYYHGGVANEITGQTSDYSASKKAAFRAMRRSIDQYRRV